MTLAGSSKRHNQYRKASAIELYDAQTIIMEWERDGGIFHEYDLPGFTIKGWLLERWARFLDLPIDSYHRTQGTYLVARHPKDHDLEITKKTYVYGEDFSNGKLISILANVVDSRLLDIRLKIEWTDSTTKEKTVQVCDITYCGTFSIEWITEELDNATE